MCFVVLSQEESRLPFLQKPRDSLREGLYTLKDEATTAHPVEKIQDAHGSSGDPTRFEMLAKVYGTALPARMEIERQILNK